jgi:hypothetical protein
MNQINSGPLTIPDVRAAQQREKQTVVPYFRVYANNLYNFYVLIIICLSS